MTIVPLPKLETEDDMRFLIVKIETTQFGLFDDRAKAEAVASELNSDALDEQSSERWVVVEEDAIKFTAKTTA